MQARLRGRDLMRAFQQGAPDLTVFLTFGHSLPRVLSEHGRKPLSETSYGLLAPFLDGLLEAARGGTRVVDGYELSYGFQHAGQFADARRLVAEGVLPIVGARDAYRERLELAFGLWIDYDWRHRGWSPSEVSHNYFTPESFEAALVAALNESDEYVWVYGETPRGERRTPERWSGGLREGDRAGSSPRALRNAEGRPRRAPMSVAS